jgi:hypothetical protein
MSNVSEFLVDTLIANGVGRVWGLPGDSLNGVTDAIRTRPQFNGCMSITVGRIEELLIGPKCKMLHRKAFC